MDVGAMASWSALVAAAATVVGAALLALFFARGEPWGTLNDVASIVLMLATIPVAVRLAEIEARSAPGLAEATAAIGIIGMLAATAAQAALVLRLGSYRGLLPYTLGAGAIVGTWYLLVGVLGAAGGMPGPLVVLAVAAGIGYIAIGYGFWRGNERHPASVAGGVVLLLASTIFLTWVGLSLLGSEALTT
jgi:hypothetical protein